MPSWVDLPLAGVSIAAMLYVIGERRAVALTGRPPSPTRRARQASFYAGLVVIAVALASPLDGYSLKLLWAHMTQHVLLLTVAPPLIVFAAPWMSIWRPIPLRARRLIARTVARSPRLRPLRGAAAALARPLPSFVAYNATIAVWHVPGMYDLTLRNQAAHDLEHVTFLVFGVLAWAQVIDSPPLRARLTQLGRIGYMTGCAVSGWLLSLVLAFYPTALYAAYAQLPHRPGGISELADQQVAAGIMLGPGSVAMTIFVFYAFYRWLGQEQAEVATG